ncbi:hypothetical protein QBC47DRAFT_370124 [Echria macrotheca]|uniref:Pentatricopeptide repeat domain-containing protein n=1 Tax=Echria macrotheca TaxID=438768 RepID=A0AAJ0FGU7_9PEZI|nr:hypothetical protein QBC47DRAFT_370124 [Echria macrotheca]
MQAVRFGTGNLRNCQSPPWKPISAAVARFATRSWPGRRRVGGSDVFTACYTGIMAAAAVIDAGQKKKRRHKVDWELIQANKQLAILMEQSAAYDIASVIRAAPQYPDPPPGVPNRHGTRRQVLRLICRHKPSYVEYGQQLLWARQAMRGRPRNEGESPWYEGDRFLGLTHTRAIAAVDERRVILEREPRTPTHFEKMAWMFSELVDELLFTAYSTMPIEIRRPATALDSAFNMIRMVRSDGYPRYVHPRTNPHETTAARFQFNQVNSQIFANWDPLRKDKLVAKICYNILVSKVPPGIRNINALLLGFTEVGEHELADVVADVFLHRSQLRPTSVTVLCLLHHYRLKGDIAGFQGILRRMTAYDSRGLRLRRRTVGEVVYSRLLRQWKRKAHTVKNRIHVLESVWLTRHTCEVILQGLLDLGMLKDAAKFFIGCVKDGVRIRPWYIHRLLNSFIGNRHPVAVNILVDGFLRNLEATTIMLFMSSRHSIEFSRKIRYLLNIAWATWLRPFRARDAVHFGVPLGVRVPKLLRQIRVLGTLAWVEELSNCLRFLDGTLKHIEGILSRDEPLLSRLAEADDSLDRMARLDDEMQEVCMRAKLMGQHTRLRLEVRYSGFRIEEFEHELASIMTRFAPVPTTETPSLPTEGGVMPQQDSADSALSKLGSSIIRNITTAWSKIRAYI